MNKDEINRVRLEMIKRHKGEPQAVFNWINTQIANDSLLVEVMQITEKQTLADFCKELEITSKMSKLSPGAQRIIKLFKLQNKNYKKRFGKPMPKEERENRYRQVYQRVCGLPWDNWLNQRNEQASIEEQEVRGYFND